MVAKVSREALWQDVAHATAVRPHAAAVRPHAGGPERSQAPDPAIEPAAPPPQAPSASPEDEAWAALLAHSESTVSALGDLTESLRHYAATQGSPAGTAAPAPGSDRELPGGMTVEDGRVLNRPGHAPRGLNKPVLPAAPALAAPADFPWPGWPRAPLPRTEQGWHPWRPFAAPVAPPQAETQPAA